MIEYFDLFFRFMRVGISTFGGGYAILPVIERELIINKHWVTIEEVTDYYAIGQVTPGVIAVNVATFIGYKRKGILGGIVATAGFILPSLFIITIAAIFLRNFAEYPLVKRAFAGIRVAVGALILNTIIRLVQGFYRDMRAVAIFIIVLGISALTSASPVLLTISSAFAGFLLYGRQYQDKPGAKEDGTP